jgi:hypothetical protein
MRHQLTRPGIPLVFASLLLAACADEPQSILSPGGAPGYATAPNLSAWSPASPIAELNTTSGEGCPFLAKHDAALHFTRNSDLYVSTWDDAAQAWGEPVNLGPGVNTEFNESCGVVLNSGKEMIYYSNRPGGVGSFDLWSATRADHRDHLGWESPVNLGVLNTGAAEFGHGAYEEEDGSLVLYFNSARQAATGQDIYMSTRPEGGTFSPPVLVPELSSPATDRDARLSKDGLEIYFASDRDGPAGNLDIWTARRERTSDPWGAPVRLGANVNSSAIEAVPTLSWDGMTLIFVSFRAGNPDLYRSTRARLTGRGR